MHLACACPQCTSTDVTPIEALGLALVRIELAMDRVIACMPRSDAASIAVDDARRALTEALVLATKELERCKV